MFNFSVSERNKLNQQSLTKEDVATQILNEHWCVNIKDFRFAKHLCVDNYIVCLTGEIDNLTTLAVKHHINVRDPLSTCLLLFQKVGIEIFEHLSGAFSLIILTPNRQAYAVRDRFGIYPLYFTTTPFRISDDLEGFNNCSVSHNAIRLYTCLQYVPEPLTIYDKVFAIAHGHLLKYDGQRVTSSLLLSSSLVPQPVRQVSTNRQPLRIALFESVEKALNHDINPKYSISNI